MAGSTSRESEKFVLRLPDGMRDRIRAAAEANNRSMNAEIVATLSEKYPAPSLTMTGEEIESLLDTLDQWMSDEEIEEQIVKLNAELAKRPLNGQYRIQLTGYNRQKLRPEFTFEVLEDGSTPETSRGRKP